jgi:acetate kinase
MNILVINSGSTSFKYSFFNKELSLIKNDEFSLDSDDGQEKFNQLFKQTLQEINEPIDVVGHRIVHGGNDFFKPTVINNDVLAKLNNFKEIAPLHNPYNILGIQAALQNLPQVKNIGVFDTGFFKNLPQVAQAYALPLEYFKKGIRRFGFHGTSHKYVSFEAARQLNKPLEDCNLITLHLGGGCSVAAIKQGQPIETSMGFTPLEGLIMATRTGDIDAGLLIHLLKKENLTVDQLDNLLNKQSGIKGLTGGLTDFKEVLDLKEKGSAEAQFAFDMFIHRIKKYIGAYLILLGKVDALVFTGAIGAGREITRQAVLNDLSLLKDVPHFAIPTDEALQIAREINQLNI